MEGGGQNNALLPHLRLPCGDMHVMTLRCDTKPEASVLLLHYCPSRSAVSDKKWDTNPGSGKAEERGIRTELLWVLEGGFLGTDVG